MTEHCKTALDYVCGVATLAVLFDHMPKVAALFTALYALLRIYEWIEKRFKRGRKE